MSNRWNWQSIFSPASCGQWYKRFGHWEFLVFWLDSCTGKFPYCDITIDSDKITPPINSNEDGKDKQVEKHKYKFRPLDFAEDCPIKTGEDAHKDAYKATVELRRNRFKDLRKKVTFRSTRPSPVSVSRVKSSEKKKITGFGTDISSNGEAGTDALSFRGARENASIHSIAPISLYQFYAGFESSQRIISKKRCRTIFLFGLLR